MFVDGTHIKANANMKKAVPKAAKIYEEQLLREINEDREEHGKKPFDDSKPPKESEVKESTTDPDSGVFHKGEHKKCFAYIKRQWDIPSEQHRSTMFSIVISGEKSFCEAGTRKKPAKRSLRP